MENENVAFSLSSKTIACNSVRAMLVSRCCVMLAAAFYFSCFASTPADAQDSPTSAGKNIVVQDKFGGQIFGYGVDQNGTEGLLSESQLLSDGKLLVATETFDQRTGKILKVVTKKTETPDDFITWGIVGSHVGLFEQEHVKGIFVDKRTFGILNPLDGNKVTGKWTPPVDGKTQSLEDVEGDQGTPNVAGMASPYACCSRFVFGSDVAAGQAASSFFSSGFASAAD